MSNTSRPWNNLIGREIETVRGMTSTIIDMTESYVTIEVHSSGELRNIPMTEIIGTQLLWNRLNRPPTPSDIRGYKVSEFNPAYTLPILLEIRSQLASQKQ